MKATCPSCNAHLNIDDKKIPAGGARIKCPTCQNIFPVKPGGDAGAVPLPGASGAPPSSDASRGAPGAVPLPGAAGAPARPPPPSSGAVPLPGITSAPAAEPSWDEESTRVAKMPIPNEAYSAPPPPPPEPESIDFGSFEPTSGAAVPLPGGGGGVSVSPATQRPPAPRGGAGAVPLPGSAAGSYEPNDSHGPGSYEPTVAGRPGGAVPLPGGHTHSDATKVGPPVGHEYSATQISSPGRGVPLPGGSKGPAAATQVGPGGRGVPLPGGSDYAAAATHVGPPGRGVPLPGGSDSAAAATHVGPPGRGVPLPGGSDYAATQIGSPAGRGVPLPGASDYAPTQIGSMRGHDRGAVPLPGSGYDMPTSLQPAYQGDGNSVPLPGEVSPHHARTTQNQAHQPQAFSFDNEPTTGAASAFNDVPEASGSDFAEVPQEPAPLPPMEFDLPTPAGQSPPPPAGGGFDFSNLPAPAGPSNHDAGGFELDSSAPPDTDLPSPAGSPYDFAPTPAQAPLPVPAAAPQQVNVSPSFGEVDLGGGDSLEFDPTSKPKRDDLEADLSAPLPPPKPTGPSDGLEMLSFIDDTAKEASAKAAPSVRRYHIKRRSGKVFGPFEEAVVVKMLEDGQLLGNEEVSLDSESWQPIGAEAAFQGAIAKLMEQPARGAGGGGGGATASQGNAQGASGTPGVSVPGNRPAPPSMERLKQLYEGRMAAVAVVQGKEPVPFKKRVPWIVAGMLVLAIGGAGAWSSQTRYGLFGLKVLFPARVGANTEEFKILAEAKKSLLADTFKGYKSTKELAEKLLRTKPYPEVRAVWIQAVSYLHRHYGASTSQEQQLVAAEQENILLLGEKHLEVVKALANVAMNAKDYDKALSLVASARARADNEADAELLFLKAEALAAKGQTPQAMADLKVVLDKDKTSAKALHALGLLHLKQKEVDLAAGRFAEAIAASPEHASSAVELASIELLERKNTAKGNELLEQALAEDRRVNLAPAELGRALALKALVAAEAKRLDDAVAAFEEALQADPGNVFAKGAYGALLVERHDFAKATPLLRDAVDKAPQNLPYVETYLNSLIGLGKMDEATKVMQAASGRFPGNGRIAFLSARVEDGMDRTKQAEESYKRAISADPTMVEANIALASLYLRLRRFAEAKPQLAEALSKAPDNAQVHVGLGELALAENNVEVAQEELNKAVDLNPNLPGAFLGLSRVALAKGKADIAEQQAQKALKLDPKIHDGRLQYGTALWKLGRLDEAIKELTQAKEDDPRSVNIPVTLGAVQLEKGDLNEATGNLLGNALQKEPGNPDANYYMARVRRRRAEYTQAIEAMKKAIDHAPRRQEFYYELGNIYLDAHKGNEAVDAWKAALAIEPKYADALEALGRDALGRNRQKEAIEYFMKVLDADPSRTRIHALIGDAHSAANQWQKAIDAYLRALSGEPGFKEVYPKLANAYQEKKKWGDAISWYRKATQADPSDLSSWLQLGYVLKEKKEYDEAVGAFRQFQNLNTDPKLKKMIDGEIYDLEQER